MIAEENIIKIPISDTIHKIAYRFAYSSNENYNKQTIRKDNGGRCVGFIGELMVLNYFYKNNIKYDWQNFDPNTPNYNFDININGFKLDIKTKDRTVDPKLFYECSIAEYSHQSCDYYVFTSLTRNSNLEYPYQKASILGFMKPDEYFSKASILKKGDIDPANNFTVVKDCRNLPIKELHSIEELIKIIA